MMNYLNLHAIAAARGDGLHPKLRELLEWQASSVATASNVESLALHRGDPHIQSGPHPASAVGISLPEGVLRFAPRESSKKPIGKPLLRHQN